MSMAALVLFVLVMASFFVEVMAAGGGAAVVAGAAGAAAAVVAVVAGAATPRRRRVLRLRRDFKTSTPQEPPQPLTISQVVEFLTGQIPTGMPLHLQCDRRDSPFIPQTTANKGVYKVFQWLFITFSNFNLKNGRHIQVALPTLVDLTIRDDGEFVFILRGETDLMNAPHQDHSKDTVLGKCSLMMSTPPFRGRGVVWQCHMLWITVILFLYRTSSFDVGLDMRELIILIGDVLMDSRRIHDVIAMVIAALERVVTRRETTEGFVEEVFIAFGVDEEERTEMNALSILDVVIYLLNDICSETSSLYSPLDSDGIISIEGVSIPAPLLKEPYACTLGGDVFPITGCWWKGDLIQHIRVQHPDFAVDAPHISLSCDGNPYDILSFLSHEEDSVMVCYEEGAPLAHPSRVVMRANS
jgi:hypothetical protein